MYGLYVSGKEFMDQKMYALAESKLQASLKKDHNYLPALVKMAELMYRNMRYTEALELAKRALGIDTDDGSANYYYGLINARLGNIVDAKDGFDLATSSVEYRSAANTELGKLYLREKDFEKAFYYAAKAIDFNRYNIEALQIQAIVYRYLNDKANADKILNTISSFDPLNHFVQFEKYFWNPSNDNKTEFISLIQNEQPQETYLELAIDYYNKECIAESEKVLQLSPANALTKYWLAFLQYKQGKDFSALLDSANNSSPAFVFPFRSEDEEVLQWAVKQNNNWKPEYYLALIYKDRNRIDESKKLFSACGARPDFAPFYAARSGLYSSINNQSFAADLNKAIELDKEQWRYYKLLTEYYIDQEKNEKALTAIENFYHSHLQNYIIGMLYAKTLLLNKRYKDCDEVLSKLNIIPFEGATIGRELYREAKLMLAIKEIQAKRYNKALQFIEAAKVWPQNLGVGKPYQEDVDERLEEWMSYRCYQQMNKTKEAQVFLQNIIQFKPKIENTTSNFFFANSLVTAWAMDKNGKRSEAVDWINQQIKQYPDNEILLWCKSVFENKTTPVRDLKDSDMRLLTQLTQFK